jgi:competence protein ComEA
VLKKILCIVALLYSAACFAAVDVNKATAAELDGIKGIGPGISEKILAERKNAPFKDWDDFISRVGGVGDKTAAKFSAEGLTVNGKRYRASNRKTDVKETAKPATPASPATPAAPAVQAPKAAAPATAPAIAATTAPATPPAATPAPAAGNTNKK